ncbi:MAG: tRNA guanosine(34) transglycosylase Tgt [Candidatus Magasanikbacteria bacterium]|nr:tRNA guanosine(34) transglycosylase Tgt [Candidatus Magasanikbacteria bacterium]
MPFFELQKTSGAGLPAGRQARAGVMHTDHGDILTPAFMPVGTQGAVKTLDSQDLENLQAPVILGNTYHLHLRPGEDLVYAAGGLHKFMNWPHPILTDSGGFQVFSLGLQKKKGVVSQARLVKIDDDGVTFTSHIDGSTHRFTPETSIEIQHKLGADIIMAFDECTPDDAAPEYARAAMERTHAWAKRSLAEHLRLSDTPPPARNASRSDSGGPPSPLRRGGESSSPLLCKGGGEGEDWPHQRFIFGIIQGGQHKSLREESARFISSLDFDGIAIGGESIGYNMPATAEILDWVYPLIPENKPHYAMGVGLNPADLLIAVEHGADMFDCVAPTRLARHGMLFTFDPPSKNRLNIKNSEYKKDSRPVDESCECSTCKNYSRQYLHHLFAAEEITALRLASIHNLHFMLNLMRRAREAIMQDKFADFIKNWISKSSDGF